MGQSIIAALTVLFLFAASPVQANDKPIPFHELVDLYEGCLSKYVGKFPPEQAYIGKSLCYCQTEAFSRNRTYAELADLVKTPGAFNGAADGYMENCVIRVQSEIKGGN